MESRIRSAVSERHAECVRRRSSLRFAWCHVSAVCSSAYSLQSLRHHAPRFEVIIPVRFTLSEILEGNSSAKPHSKFKFCCNVVLPIDGMCWWNVVDACSKSLLICVACAMCGRPSNSQLQLLLRRSPLTVQQGMVDGDVRAPLALCSVCFMTAMLMGRCVISSDLNWYVASLAQCAC